MKIWKVLSNMKIVSYFKLKTVKSIQNPKNYAISAPALNNTRNSITN